MTKPMMYCPDCQFSTDNRANFRRRRTNIHHDPVYRNPHIDWTQAALHGLPTCKHCNQSFTTWRSFKIHVERQTCQVSTTDLTSTALAVHTEARHIPDTIVLPHTAPAGPFDFDEAISLFAEHMTTADDLRVRLLVGDLAHLHAQPFGEFVLDAVRSLDWTSLTHDREACKHMTSYCTICGIYVGCCRSLLAHLKLYHGDLMNNVMAKSAQLTYTHAATSPCPFCQKTFKKGHVCPVFLQARLLLLNGGGCDMAAGRPHVLRVLTCEICNETVGTVAAMNQHLRAVHRLATFDWNPSRDSTEGGPTCAHCGKRHTTLESLRCHITFGHCANFDATRTAETRAVDPDLAHALKTGVLPQYLQDSTNRLQLTLTCLNCGESYSRCSDLNAHLQTCHCKLWRTSTPLMPLLTEAIVKPQGCICNPSLTVALAAHTCVGLRQLAMQFTRLPEQLLIPHGYTSSCVERIVHSSIPDSVRQIIFHALIERRFDQLWNDLECLRTLRTRCTLCGQQHPAAALCAHVQEHHITALTPHIMTQLQPLLIDNMNSHVCNFCALTFDSPHMMTPELHTQAAQIHLRALCPVAIQIAVLLASPQDDAQHGRGRTVSALPGFSGSSAPPDGSNSSTQPTNLC